MNNLGALVTELESYLPDIDRKNEKVSTASVGWHIEHSLLSMVKMISALQHSDPLQYKKSFNLKRSFVLTTGKIPRGRAKAPESVRPGEVISISTITPLLDKAKEKLALFESLNKRNYFTHPVFGDVRVNTSRKVIAIHTIHHLKIIRDILNNK